MTVPAPRDPVGPLPFVGQEPGTFPAITPADLTGDYVFGPPRTRIGFVARHTLGTRVRGRFTQFAGSAHLDGSDPSKSSVRLTIRARSIRTDSRRRDDRLRSVFLAVDGHQSLRFVSTGVRRSSASGFAVTGDLTVRGVTRAVTLGLDLSGVEDTRHGGLRVRFTGGATVDRRAWGVDGNAATGLLVSPAVHLELDIAATRQDRW